MTIPKWMRKEVILRACNRCEYCLLSQTGQEAAFHLDHVIPVSEGGETKLDNLALACVSCSPRKGARRKAPDPLSRHNVPLYDPRQLIWTNHFIWIGHRIPGRSASGRATISLLKTNRQLMVAIHVEESTQGRHQGPPID